MILFLFGDDLFSLNEKLKEIKLSYEKKSKLKFYFRAIDLREDKDARLKDFKDFLKLMPMFTAKKLVILKGLEVLKSRDKKDLKRFLDKIDAFKREDEIIVLIHEGKIKKTEDFFKKIIRNSKFQEFKNEDKELRAKKLVMTFIKRHGLKIEKSTLPLFVNSFKNDLLLLENELRKVSAYAKTEIIDDEKFREIFTPKEDLNIFDFLDPILKKNKSQALKKISQLLDRENEFRILGLLKASFETLLLVKYLREKGLGLVEIQKKLNKHTFYIQKLLGYARNFSLEELIKIYKQFFELELRLKLGAYKNTKLLFQLFLLKIV